MFKLPLSIVITYRSFLQARSVPSLAKARSMPLIYWKKVLARNLFDLIFIYVEQGTIQQQEKKESLQWMSLIF
jgi:hypothetical protein